MGSDIIRVTIGIQARSNSSRFPKKIFQTIGNKTVIDHVIDACLSSARYLNAHADKSKISTKVVLLCPLGDDISETSRIPVVQGDPNDVLSRYVCMADKFNSDYIVRITGDCPLIPPPVITAHINKCVRNDLDYLSNVGQDRVSIDGHDCEIFSRHLLDWLDEHSEEEELREHVTILARENPPEWARTGHVVGYADLSKIKLSLDTPKDLDIIKDHFNKITNLIEDENHEVHRF